MKFAFPHARRKSTCATTIALATKDARRVVHAIPTIAASTTSTLAPNAPPDASEQKPDAKNRTGLQIGIIFTLQNSTFKNMKNDTVV